MARRTSQGEEKRRPPVLTLNLTEATRDIGGRIDMLADETGLSKTQVMAAALRHGLRLIERDRLLLITPTEKAESSNTHLTK